MQSYFKYLDVFQVLEGDYLRKWIVFVANYLVNIRIGDDWGGVMIMVISQ
ncbi:hypothetical protein NIES3974_16550 [Calothrix sp. NIES-3974]|nr:hypothetical protein NIES3974_16550 [Calothrix sp. NIES-3974]